MSATRAAVTGARAAPPKLSVAGWQRCPLHCYTAEVHRSLGSELPFAAGDLILGVALSFWKFNVVVVVSKKCFLQA